MYSVHTQKNNDVATVEGVLRALRETDIIYENTTLEERFERLTMTSREDYASLTRTVNVNENKYAKSSSFLMQIW